MSDFMQDPIITVAITGAITVVTGVLVYVLGQAVQNFILKPIQDFRVVLVQISHKVKFWENYLINSGLREDKTKQCRADMRDLASNLESKYIIIPFKKQLLYFNMVPAPENVRTAARNLIFLSNAGGESGSEGRNNEAIDLLRKKLDLTL